MARLQERTTAYRQVNAAIAESFAVRDALRAGTFPEDRSEHAAIRDTVVRLYHVTLTPGACEPDERLDLISIDDDMIFTPATPGVLDGAALSAAVAKACELPDLWLIRDHIELQDVYADDRSPDDNLLMHRILEVFSWLYSVDLFERMGYGSPVTVVRHGKCIGRITGWCNLAHFSAELAKLTDTEDRCMNA